MPAAALDSVKQQPAVRRRRARWTLAIAAFAAGLLVAVAFDAWYAWHVEEEVRAGVRQRAASVAAALGASADRRIALLEGLRSYVEAQGSRAALDVGFPVFAQGIVAGTDGVRALQLVQSGRIVRTWPVVGNEEAIGLNLLALTTPGVAEGVRRAMATTDVVVTGPVALVQGGEGLLVRRRVEARPGFPDLATLVLDVPALVREGGIPHPESDLRFAVLDRAGEWFAGDSAALAIAPESLSVSVPDGNWTLLAAPSAGWDAMVSPALNASRLGSLGFIIALTLIGLIVGARQDRLSATVATRESTLGVALRAGRMGTWTLDFVADRSVFDEAAAAVMGRTPSELAGPVNDLLHVVHPDDVGFVSRVFGELLESTRTDYMLEYRVQLPDGSPRWILTMGEVERAADGRPLRIQGVVSDSSTRREMADRLRHSERIETVGTLAGSVAHDFNNLLTAMISFIDLALEQLPEDAGDQRVQDARADLQEALRVAGRASGLTGQLLAFSRRTAPEPRRIVVGDALADLSPMLRRLLGERIALTVHSAPDVPAVWIDPNQLTQVLLNLVVNARDSIEGRGEILIGAHLVGPGTAPPDAPAGTWVMIEVRDSGAGMSEAVRQRIFEPYFTTKASAQGTGLGLAVVLGVVRGVGGHVSVESAEGAGSRFRIYLPPRPLTSEHPLPSGETRA